MRSIIISTLFCATLISGASISEPQNDKQAKVFLFNVVKFKNGPCSSTSTTMGSGHRNGTCFTENECKDKNGISAGGCASGFGVCCVFMLSECDTTVQENCTYVRNPGYPNSIATLTTCKFTVEKADKDICTMRLDFEAFNIIGPSDTVETDGGKCLDKFVASSANTGSTSPEICGENAGEHMYIEMGADDKDTGSLEFTFDPADTNGRTFEIKITQIFCNAVSRPPDGCLQYHFGTDGRMSTFNFASGTATHLASQRYGICVRQEEGFCCIKYQVCTDDQSFGLDIEKDMAADFISQTDTACAKDYITIEASSSTCQVTDAVNRYCGQQLADADTVKAVNLEICDCTAPFRVGIVTDAAADTKSDTFLSRGVCLNYVQTPCGQVP